eukprot:s444_g25.t1
MEVTMTGEYQKQGEAVGEGTYGTVWKGIRCADNAEVAMKKVILRHQKEGFPSTAIREIRALRALHNHPNVVKLHDVYTEMPGTNGVGDAYLIFEYVQHDLTGGGVSWWLRSLDAFDALRREWIEPDSWTFVAVMGTVEHRKCWALVVQYLQQMHLLRVPWEVMTLTTAIALCEWQQVLALLEEMKRLNISANVVTSTSVITACTRGSQWLKAIDMFAKLPAQQQLPNEVTHGAVAAACEKGQQWKSALRLCLCAANVVARNAALASMRDSGNWRMGLHVLTSPNDFSVVRGGEGGPKLQSRKVKQARVDAISFSSVASICEHAGDEEYDFGISLACCSLSTFRSPRDRFFTGCG